MGGNSKKMSKSDWIKWACTIGFPILVMLIPVNETFTGTIRLFLAGTLMAILMFAFENVNQTAVALALPFFYVLTNMAPSAVVFGPWTQFIPWMMVGGLLLAGVLEKVGLLRRVACKAIVLTGGSYNGIIWGLAFTGVLCAFTGAGVVPMVALSYGVCLAMNTGKSPASAGIMLASAVGVLVPGTWNFMGPILSLGVGASVTGPMEMLGFFEAWWVNMPSILFFLITIFLITKMMKPETAINGKDYFIKEVEKMGKMSLDEKKALLIVLALFLFLITGNGVLHHIEIGWGYAVFPLLFFLPGIEIANGDDIRKCNWGFIFFITACMGIGAVAGALGLGQIIAAAVLPYLQGQSSFLFFAFEWILLVSCNFLLTPLAMQAAFTVPLAQIALSLGINPMAVYYIMLHACDQIIMPYEYALYLIFFSFGLIRLKDFIKVMGMKMVVNIIIVFAALIPFWNLIGFLHL